MLTEEQINDMQELRNEVKEYCEAHNIPDILLTENTCDCSYNRSTDKKLAEAMKKIDRLWR